MTTSINLHLLAFASQELCCCKTASAEDTVSVAHMAQGTVYYLMQEKQVSLMPLFPHIFDFRTIRGGLGLSYTVLRGISADA